MKDVKGYEGLYAVTSCGKVWSYKRQKFLEPQLNENGYWRVCLYKDRKEKKYMIHRLVAEAYIPNPNNLPQVDHIDENKTHNYINNLQWITNRDNCRKSHNKTILQYTIEGEFVRKWSSATDVGREAQSNIWYCLNGRTKTAYGYIWKYKN